MIAIFNPLKRPVEWVRRRNPHGPSSRPRCSLVDCPGRRPLWERLLRRNVGALLHGDFYCGPRCLEAALVEEISRLRAMAPQRQPPNRIPLGLLMVARGKLTHIEVRAALEAQRRARYGRIGDWIEKLGFASEQDVTAALALQWGCPVATSFDPSAVISPGNIPLPILEAFQMLPVNYAAASNTLYLACGARVEHAALYGIEKVLECRTQPCVAPPRSIARQLEAMRQNPHPCDVEFVTRDLAEMARIASSYAARLSPQEIRLSRLGKFIWLRLKSRPAPTNLLFCLQPQMPEPAPPSMPAAPPRSAERLRIEEVSPP